MSRSWVVTASARCARSIQYRLDAGTSPRPGTNHCSRSSWSLFIALSFAPFKQKEHECLLRVKSIFCFVEDHRIRAVRDLGRYFFADVRRQTVHEQEIGPGRGGEPLVDLIWGQELQSSIAVGFTTHGGPHVGVDDVGVPN